MTKLFKKLSVVVASLLLIGSISSQAATATYTIDGRTNLPLNVNGQPYAWTNLINQAVKVTGINITTVSGAATNLLYAFIDAPLTNANAKYWLKQGLSNPAYMGVIAYTTNLSVYETNSAALKLAQAGVTINDWTGFTNYYVISNVTYTVTNTVNAGVTAWDTRLTGTATSNGVVSSVTIPDSGVYFFRGLTLTNPSVPLLYQVQVTYETF